VNRRRILDALALLGAVAILAAVALAARDETAQGGRLPLPWTAAR
jgi:hypothetical protein